MVEYVYAPVVAAAQLSFKGLGLKIDLRGTENVPRRGGAVLASNHVSYLDFIYAGLGAHPSGRYVRFMAKDSVWKNPVAGPLMRGMKHIPVDRDAGAESFRVALDMLRGGEIVGIFPQATISRSFELKDFKSGAARLAQAAGVPMLPTVIWGIAAAHDQGAPARLLTRQGAVGHGRHADRGAPGHRCRGCDRGAQGRDGDHARRRDRSLSAEPERARRHLVGAGQDGGTAPTLAEATRMDRLEAVNRAKRESG